MNTQWPVEFLLSLRIHNEALMPGLQQPSLSSGQTHFQWVFGFVTSAFVCSQMGGACSPFISILYNVVISRLIGFDANIILYEIITSHHTC